MRDETPHNSTQSHNAHPRSEQISDMISHVINLLFNSGTRRARVCIFRSYHTRRMCAPSSLLLIRIHIAQRERVRYCAGGKLLTRWSHLPAASLFNLENTNTRQLIRENYRQLALFSWKQNWVRKAFQSNVCLKYTSFSQYFFHRQCEIAHVHALILTGIPVLMEKRGKRLILKHCSSFCWMLRSCR